MKAFTSIFIFVLVVVLSRLSFAQNFGKLLSSTNYDHAYNANHLKQLDMGDPDGDFQLNPFIIIQRRLDMGFSIETLFFYKKNDVWNSINPFAIQNTSSNSLQYCEGGPLNGKILLCGAYQGTTYFSLFDPITETIIRDTVTLPVTFPSFHYSPNGVIWVFDDLNLNIYKSSDLSSAFLTHAVVGDGDPRVSLNGAGGPIRVSKNGQHLSVVGGFENSSTSAPPEIVYLYSSSDFGNSWNGQIIGVTGEYGQVINRNYAPLFTNFSQISAAVDNNGVTHVAANGYGMGVHYGNTDTVDVFPVLYWNSRDRDWLSITLEDYEVGTDSFNNYVLSLYPGTGIGNAYPSILVSEDGENIAVTWQSYTFSGRQINNPWNIYPGDGGSNSLPIYYTNICSNASTDGGNSWLGGYIFLNPIDPVYTQQYCITAPVFNGTWLGYGFSYIYQYDATPGVSLFNQNGPNSDGGWYYNNFEFLFTPVEDEEIKTVNDFNLEQNYPNPFNPSTKIKYTIPNVISTEGRNLNVTLKVYDVLGNEVATLVNEQKPAGSYEVEFNASNLPAGRQGLTSGVYFYQLKTGSFVETKKMILIK